MHLPFGSSSRFIRAASTTSQLSTEDLNAALPARYGPVQNATNSSQSYSYKAQEDFSEPHDIFISTKRLLSHMYAHHRQRIAASIRKLSGNVEHIERMVLPGLRREIYCAAQGLDNVARASVIASDITRRKLNSAMAKFLNKKGEHIEKTLLELRRDVYTAITGIDLAKAPHYHIQMEKLRWLMAKKSKAAEYAERKTGSWFIETVETERKRVEKIRDVREDRKERGRKAFRDSDRNALKPDFKIRMHFANNHLIEGEPSKQDSVSNPKGKPAVEWPETSDIGDFEINPMEEYYAQFRSPLAKSTPISTSKIHQSRFVDQVGQRKAAKLTPSSRLETGKPESIDPVEKRKAEVIPPAADSNPPSAFRIRKYESGDPRLLVQSSVSAVPPEISTAPFAFARSPIHLPHLTSDGSAHMVNVTDKDSTHRVAVATGYVHFSEPGTHQLIRGNLLKKGDVLGTARVAGIMAAKNCPALVPLCHPIVLSGVAVDVKLLDGPQMYSNMGNGRGDGDVLSLLNHRNLEASFNNLLSTALDIQREHTKSLESTTSRYTRLGQEIADFQKSIEAFVTLEHERPGEERIKDLETEKDAITKEKVGKSERLPKISRFEMDAKSLRSIYAKQMQKIAALLKGIETHNAKANESLSQLEKIADKVSGLFSNPPERESGYKDQKRKPDSYGAVRVEAKVECVGPTGVEMEALTSVSAAALTVIDMIKAVDRNARIDAIKMVMKKGGKSGTHVDSMWVSDPHRAYDAK